METLSTLATLKVIHIAATVLLLLSGLALALLAWRKRSAGPAVTVQRPWVFVWLLMGLCVVSMPFTGWWLVHLVGWPLGQTWILGSSILYTVAALTEAGHWLVARRKRYPAEQQRLLVITDGRLKAISGLPLLACPGLLVDIERGPIRLGRARDLAAGLQLDYRHIDKL